MILFLIIWEILLPCSSALDYYSPGLNEILSGWRPPSPLSTFNQEKIGGGSSSYGKQSETIHRKATVPVLDVPVHIPPTEKNICDGTKPYCLDNLDIRSIDGTCNNVKNPYWGASGAPFTRVNGPRYASSPLDTDIKTNSDPLTSILPNPKLLSAAIFKTPPSGELKRDTSNSMLAMAMMHFVLNDLSLPAEPGNTNLDCCREDVDKPECWPIVDPGSVEEQNNICEVMGAEKREECCSPDPEWKTCGDCTPCDCETNADCPLNKACEDSQCIEPTCESCNEGEFCQTINHQPTCRDCSELPPNPDQQWEDVCN